MIVTITSDGSLVEDADDCTRLHISADGLDDAAVGAALLTASLGRPGEPDHAWIAVDKLRAVARVASRTPGWDARFDAMIAYARSKGWLDASGEHVAAHVERSPS